jgi:hypothetical protein
VGFLTERDDVEFHLVADMVCMVSFFPFHAAFIVTDAEVAKGISDLQESITKEVHAYKILEYFGLSMKVACWGIFFFSMLFFFFC